MPARPRCARIRCDLAARSRRRWRALACALAAFACGMAGAATDASAAPSASASPHPYAAHVAAASQRFAIPEVWIWRVMHVESRGRAGAVSRAGARGLMQIMPGTWAMLTARHRLGPDPFDTRANILAGAAYLRHMWDRYGDVRLMLAAYNAGPGRADAYAAGRRGLPAETVAYVAAIVPHLGAPGAAPPATTPHSVAPSWRSAGIFAARQDEGLLPTDARDDGAAKTAAAPAERMGPARPSLFVPLSGHGE
ncbi:lytic transglycosylase domain-containing protein [Sphingopyxis sp. R3-92]|uniref:lytic transglycosylase domain-containing protein n=1 Tax=Sphingopyxis sp. R3-92 TaxID=3158553 RepID=UPI003EE484CB